MSENWRLTEKEIFIYLKDASHFRRKERKAVAS